jgi:hypothetical protein
MKPLLTSPFSADINWAGVGEALGGLKPNSVQKRWKRFKDTSVAGKSPTGQSGAKNVGTIGSKKRTVAEMNGDEVPVVRNVPATNATAKQLKTENAGSKEQRDGRWAVKKEAGLFDSFDAFERAEA